MPTFTFSSCGRVLLAGTLLLAACSKNSEPAPTPSLYDRVGQTQGISNLVDNLIVNVAAEAATSNSVMLRSHRPLLDAVNGVNGAAPTDPARLQRLRDNFINQLGEATGGPLKYTGKSMLAAHTGMNITSAEYSVWFAQWEKALATCKVSGQERTELNTILNNMKNDVVGR